MEMTSFRAQSKQMAANGGTGTVGFQSITTRSSQNNGCTATKDSLVAIYLIPIKVAK